MNGFSAKIEEQWPLYVFRKQLEAAIPLSVHFLTTLFNVFLHIPGVFQIQVSKHSEQHVPERYREAGWEVAEYACTWEDKKGE